MCAFWILNTSDNKDQLANEVNENELMDFGVSHGLAGILCALGIGYSEGIIVEGQKEAIEIILEILKKYALVSKYGKYTKWSPKLSKTQFDNRFWKNKPVRDSWCYGAIGIARSIYISAKTINNTEYMNWALEMLLSCCKTEKEHWGLDLAILCHGYSGMLSIDYLMFEESGDRQFIEGIEKCIASIIELYNQDEDFGFITLEESKSEANNINIINNSKMCFLEGTSGILLSLLLIINKYKGNWMRHLMIN